MENQYSEVLDRSNPEPLYKQIKSIISSQITDGTLKFGDRLTSERLLCKKHGVSHITVRQALVSLTGEGWLHRAPGKGTFVKDPKVGVKNSLQLPIGVVLPESNSLLTKTFIADFFIGISAGLGGSEYPMVYYSNRDVIHLQDALQNKIQGLIVSGVEEPQWSLFKRNGIPFVLIGDWVEDGVFTVDIDNCGVANIQCSHLIEQSCRRIGLILGSPDPSPFNPDRLKGYTQALSDHGFSFDGKLVVQCDYTIEGGRVAAHKLLGYGVDGIMCVDDIVAVGALKAAAEKGLRIPEDLALIGCNNTSLGADHFPSISTVDLEPITLGRLAAKTLLGILSKEKLPNRTEVSGHLVPRTSSKRNNA